ncbi:YybH family protein [Rheinheimera fenheensis]|uniref:YybH family protein n=1 Tax=Rheinheimera fenheensis TaxID=3152295 RepID=UPI00325C53FB
MSALSSMSASRSHCTHDTKPPSLLQPASLQHGATQLIHQLQQAFFQRDLSAMAHCFAEEAILVNILGQRLHGRDAICHYIHSTFADWQDEWLSYRLEHITPLADNMAVVNVQQYSYRRSDNRISGISAAPLWVIGFVAGRWQILACNAL